MIFIDPEEIDRLIPEELKQQLIEASNQLRLLPASERVAYIKRNDKMWSNIRPYLAAVTGEDHKQNDFKCWYCEEKSARFTYHVDHYRPKGRVKDKNREPEAGYWWLAFDFRNYRLSCEYCNSPHSDDDDAEVRGKWDQFPLKEGSHRASSPEADLDEEIRLLIDPTMSSEVILLSFDDIGMIRPLAEEGNYVYELVSKTIEVLNLNQARIVEARKQKWLSCQKKVQDGNEEWVKYSKTGSPIARNVFERICVEIRELVQPYSEFSAMARSYFKGTGEPWVLNLLIS